MKLINILKEIQILSPLIIDNVYDIKTYGEYFGIETQEPIDIDDNNEGWFWSKGYKFMGEDEPGKYKFRDETSGEIVHFLKDTLPRYDIRDVK